MGGDKERGEVAGIREKTIFHPVNPRTTEKNQIPTEEETSPTKGSEKGYKGSR